MGSLKQVSLTVGARIYNTLFASVRRKGEEWMDVPLNTTCL